MIIICHRTPPTPKFQDSVAKEKHVYAWANAKWPECCFSYSFISLIIYKYKVYRYGRIMKKKKNPEICNNLLHIFTNWTTVIACNLKDK